VRHLRKINKEVEALKNPSFLNFGAPTIETPITPMK
jgi:hypothetical protein